MVYANDQWVQLPVADIFDTTMMQLALASAKEMYDKGEERIKDFKKSYGEFYSPSAKDMQWYADQFSPDEVLSDLYNKGIDPLRSPEGRAMVNKWINSRPIGEFNARKQQAENIRTYLKNYAELERLGKLDKNREAWELQQIPGFEGSSVADWDFSKNGMFDRLSPSSTNSLYEDTNPWFNKYKPEVIMRANKDANGNYIPDPNGKYNVIGITDERIRHALDTNLLDYVSTGGGAWQYELSKRQLQSEGIENPSDNQIIDRLKDNIISANDSVLYRTEQENPEYVRTQEHAFQVDLQNRQQAFQASENAKNRAQNDRHHQDDVMVSLLKAGVSPEDLQQQLSGEAKEVADLVSRLDKTAKKGIMHFSGLLGLQGANTFLRGVPNKDLLTPDQIWQSGVRGNRAKLTALFNSVPGISSETHGGDPWKLPSQTRWNLLFNDYNNFKTRFINAYSDVTANRAAIAAYISGKNVKKNSDGYFVDQGGNRTGRLVTADQIIRNTKELYSYNNEETQLPPAVYSYQPTGRVVTIIDKQNRRAQYFELAVSTRPGGDIGKNLVYYKALNTTAPKDIAGPVNPVGFEWQADGQSSHEADNVVFGSKSDTYSGGSLSLEQ